jgi:hypothetical protein
MAQTASRVSEQPHEAAGRRVKPSAGRRAQDAAGGKRRVQQAANVETCRLPATCRHGKEPACTSTYWPGRK